MFLLLDTIPARPKSSFKRPPNATKSPLPREETRNTPQITPKPPSGKNPRRNTDPTRPSPEALRSIGRLMGSPSANIRSFSSREQANIISNSKLTLAGLAAGKHPTTDATTSAACTIL